MTKDKGRDRDRDKKLSKGDKVSWSSHGQTVPGKVKKKITGRAEVAGRTVDASKDEPQYEVESDKSGRSAVHKPGSLREKSSGS
ncbi:DUF2945 domain-containing protein [Streptomyces sp. NPDC127119]|uniref:DUF2945 domain-containing protein n=1 Tax=Streptomyces sp. NPDC127119 TaxID=3345370 RepID=UPI00363A97A8